MVLPASPVQPLPPALPGITPPGIARLRALNTLVGGATYLAVSMASASFLAAGWSFERIGLCIAIANVFYSVLVKVGGRLSDRWGRARTAILGGVLGVAGCVIPLVLAGPWPTTAALFVVFAAGAIFFPGNVGLFSDAAPLPGHESAPLHRTVSAYNVGWSLGNLGGFITGWLVPGDSARLGFVLALVAFAVIAPALWRWRSLPPSPPRAEGDRAPHPALSRLTLLGRAGLLIHCMGGMAVIGLGERAIKASWNGLDVNASHLLISWLLGSYALGYLVTFWLLGRWSGWVMHPLRLFALTAIGLPASAAVLLVAGQTAQPVIIWLVLAGLVLGLSFAGVYTASIYYSLRVPVGAAAAAAWHEASLGIGSVLGPVIAGVALTAWEVNPWGRGLCGLGWWLLIVFAAIALLQLVLLPGIFARLRK